MIYKLPMDGKVYSIGNHIFNNVTDTQMIQTSPIFNRVEIHKRFQHQNLGADRWGISTQNRNANKRIFKTTSWNNIRNI